MIEPQAGSWKTWVLTSGSQFRLPAPPDERTTAAELQWLRQFRSEADDMARDQADYWSAGSPGFRWVELVTARVLDERTGRLDVPRVYALVTAAVYDATIAAWDSKYAYNRPRPSEADRSLVPETPAPRSPSYPSEHAAVAMAVAGVLSYLYPAEAAGFNALAEEAGRSRLVAGHHFPSDVLAGYQLGRAVAEKVIERARNSSDRPRHVDWNKSDLGERLFVEDLGSLFTKRIPSGSASGIRLSRDASGSGGNQEFSP
jgi:membrane-associated phospholipid phosphatase